MHNQRYKVHQRSVSVLSIPVVWERGCNLMVRDVDSICKHTDFQFRGVGEGVATPSVTAIEVREKLIQFPWFGRESI